MIVLAAAAALAQTGCEPGGQSSQQNGGYGSSGPHDDEVTLSSRLEQDLSGARGFVIAPSGTSVASGQQATNTLYLVDHVNEAHIVTVTEDRGKTVRPLAVFDTKKYVVVNYDRYSWPRLTYRGQLCSGVLIRKSDGAMYCADLDLNCNEWSRCNEDMVQADSTGDLIYVRSDSIQRLDMRNPSRLTVTTLIKRGTDGQGQGLAVNADGDALVTFDSVDHSVRFLRAYGTNGGFTPISTGWGKDCIFSGIGQNSGFLYYVDTGQNRIYQLEGAGGLFRKSVYYDYNWYNPDGIELGPLNCYLGGQFARTDDRIFMRSADSNVLVELVNPSARPARYVLNGIARIDRMRGYADKLVIQAQDDSGNGTILRYDVNTHEAVTVLAPGEYTLSAIGVSVDGDISFSGQRARDGARVMAEIPAGTQTVRVLNTSLGEITQILPIVFEE